MMDKDIQELITRLQSASVRLSELSLAAKTNPSKLRLYGKKQGVELAISYAMEYLRE
jgi:hypothetical protein